TLRDGQQTLGVQFSAAEKAEIALMLDDLGVDYIEGGWPGANPTDSEFFERPPQTRARLTAFGMTKRAGRSAGNDEVLASVMNAGTAAVCLVGKTHDFHVTEALGITLDENVQNIAESIAHITASREAIFDAEHFFDGWKANRDYALRCLIAARDAGARWIVLCDTNGGTLPAEIGAITAEVIAAGIEGARLGIHTHDDTGTAVAGALAAVGAGARQVQGTLNGLGERCGNANLTTLIANFALKPEFAGLEIGTGPEALRGLSRISQRLDEILNRIPERRAPYVGASAFAHKAGLHASAILKNPATYEHVTPDLVGNERIIPMSNQAGQSNLRARLAEAGITAGSGDDLAAILTDVKDREDQGYAYDAAQGSFELLARRHLGLLPRFFDVERYRVIVERRRNAMGVQISVSEAVVAVRMGDQLVMSVSESHGDEGDDRGPVNALWRALAKDLGPYQGSIDAMHLADFRVRITQGGTDAVTRVIIDSADTSGNRWSTVGVSANIVDASFEALIDAITWKLVHDQARPA
ncbi:MAG: citramalate synthase, partial [Paracoccus sp. (in: a-proteobacteria)]|nr:citramalate synthase [Paracoccus sp. (in: a-proteobacteria)]